MAIESILGDLKLDAVKKILHAVNTVVQFAPVSTWAGALDSTNAFLKLVGSAVEDGDVLISVRCQ